MIVFREKEGIPGMPIEHRILTCLAQGGYKPPVSGGLFNLFIPGMVSWGKCFLGKWVSEGIDLS